VVRHSVLSPQSLKKIGGERAGGAIATGGKGGQGRQ
jgi:hypothetical protein